MDANSGDNSTHRPRRITRLLPKYDDYVNSDTLIQQLLAGDNDDIAVPIDHDRPFTSVVDTISSTNAIICSLHDDDATDPQTIKEAKRSSYWAEWLSIINSKLESLKAKGVYEEVHVLPPHRKPVQCKWVWHIKQDKDGTISHFKAHLVAKGFTQIPGQDFTFTFTPVARWDSIRSLLCIAATKDFEIRQLDVKTAYLNGPLDEEIYMKAPEGFDFSSPFWCLRKGLYGLRQAGWQWYLTLHNAYTNLGFTRCQSDWSVYTCQSSSGFTMSTTSVDDIILASDSKSESDRASMEINAKFSVRDSGNTEWTLGCRITRNRSKCLLMIDQAQFVTSILRQFKMDECNSVTTPCPKWRLSADMCPSTDAEKVAISSLPYCAIVGKCMYLATCSHPDITYTVHKLARFMSNYRQWHFEAAKHLLQYLQGTRYRGIIYGNTENLTPVFTTFADSDWGMADNHKSVSGYIIECGGDLLSGVLNNKPSSLYLRVKPNISLAHTAHDKSSGCTPFFSNLVFRNQQQHFFIVTTKARLPAATIHTCTHAWSISTFALTLFETVSMTELSI